MRILFVPKDTRPHFISLSVSFVVSTQQSSTSGFERVYINLITSFVYSVAVPPIFIVNLFKDQVSFGLLELAVPGRPVSVSSEATKGLLCKVSSKR